MIDALLLGENAIKLFKLNLSPLESCWTFWSYCSPFIYFEFISFNNFISATFTSSSFPFTSILLICSCVLSLASWLPTIVGGSPTVLTVVKGDSKLTKFLLPSWLFLSVNEVWAEWGDACSPAIWEFVYVPVFVCMVIVPALVVLIAVSVLKKSAFFFLFF